jgi:hypothetical protein
MRCVLFERVVLLIKASPFDLHRPTCPYRRTTRILRTVPPLLGWSHLTLKFSGDFMTKRMEQPMLAAKMLWLRVLKRRSWYEHQKIVYKSAAVCVVLFLHENQVRCSYRLSGKTRLSLHLHECGGKGAYGMLLSCPIRYDATFCIRW